jgi:predicted HNH restriction endonuclease
LEDDVAAYLLTWNPANSPWNDIKDNIREIKEIGYHLSTRCVCNAKNILEGDRLFLLQQSTQDELEVLGIGLVASGWAASDVFEDKHWNAEKATAGQTSLYVEACFDIILDPKHEAILPRTALSEGVLSRQNWDIKSSGSAIEEEVAIELEKVWAAFLTSKGLCQHTKLEEFYPYQDEEDYEFDEAADDDSEDEADLLTTVQRDIVAAVLEESSHEELQIAQDGELITVLTNQYERDAELRAAAIRVHGTTCQACGFSFEQAYGSYGKGYIQVHHKRPISSYNGSIEIDPNTDLAVLCSNCHSIIHRKPQNPLTIEEVQGIVKAVRS